MRKNPFEEIEALLDNFSQQFEVGGSHGVGLVGPNTTAVDVVEYDDEFVVTADLPGYSSSDIELTISDGMLRLNADRESEIEESDDTEDQQFIRRERTRQSVNRRIRIPGDVDEDSVEATHKNGVLTITLPKLTASGDSKRIDID